MGAFVIAEAGVNHNGDVGRALEMVDAAADAGADAVKFQTFVPDLLVTGTAAKAPYQRAKDPGSPDQKAMLQALVLPFEAHRRLKARAEARGIAFMSTPFDPISLHVLADELGLKRIKIGSGDLTDARLLFEAACLRVDLILSTGMTTLDEVRHALGIVAHGYRVGIDGFERGPAPTQRDFDAAFASAEGRDTLQKRLVLMQCTTAYPAPVEAANLRAMKTLRDQFGVEVGYSDHTPGIDVALLAASLGATVIEKHFTLDRSLPGPDHAASLEPDEFRAMVDGIRDPEARRGRFAAVEAALGDGIKRPAGCERENIAAARKSLVAGDRIPKGAKFTRENLAAKRPGTGVSAARYWDWIGRTATRDYARDEMIVRDEVYAS